MARAMRGELWRYEDRLRDEIDESDYATFRAVLGALGRGRFHGRRAEKRVGRTPAGGATTVDE